MVIFADYSGDDGFSADDRGPARPGRTAFSCPGPLLPGLARPVAVVMDQGTRRAPGPGSGHRGSRSGPAVRGGVPMTRSLTTFMLGILGEVVMIRSPSALNTSPNVVTARAS